MKGGKTYLVILCPKCGSVRYVKEGQKTALCLRCDYRIILNPLKIRILLRTESREAALEAVKKYKMRAAKTSNKIKRIKEFR